MTVYIDSDFKCYTSPEEGRTAVETDFFDGRCAAFIEGYRFVPAGQTWTREDGRVFTGEMVAPWMDYWALAMAQTQYEQDETEHMAEVAELVDMIYESDMEVISS